MTVTHFAFDFGTRHQCRNRIDDQHVDRVRSHQRVDDLERLFAGIRLRDNQFINVDAELFGISWIECVLGIDKSRSAAVFLGFGNNVKRERCFARAFRSINFDHPAAWQTTNAQSNVQT